MKTTTTVVINPANCKYTVAGENISEMRLVALRPIASAMNLTPGDKTKNELLTEIVGRLVAMDAPLELSELGSDKP